MKKPKPISKSQSKRIKIQKGEMGNTITSFLEDEPPKQPDPIVIVEEPESDGEYTKKNLEELGFEFQVLPTGNRINLTHDKRFTVDGIFSMKIKGKYCRTIECKIQFINKELAKFKNIIFIG